MEEKLILKHKYITHPKDVEYFKEYPAPVMESIHSLHFTNINSTIPFFGPMLYFFARAMEAHTVLEIGHAECYTAWYLANAVKDNGIRYNVKTGMYYGIDIRQTDKAKDNLKDFPNTIINMDSILITPETFKGITFDIIFQDGNHDTEHVLHEFKTLWPQLKGNGLGYWIAHDTRGPAEDGYKKTIEYIKKNNLNAQYINLDDNIYGLGLFRKMDGYDYSKSHWTP